MANTRRMLSGAAKDAALKRMLAAEPGLDDATRERLMARLQDAISLIGLRQPVRQPTRSSETAKQPPPVTAATWTREPHPAADAPPEHADSREAEAAREPFDPYSPNVIVVFRTRGREAVLAELEPIDDIECLRLLAREQQLGIASDLADPGDIRQAIVAAAERRVANRRAAAS